MDGVSSGNLDAFETFAVRARLGAVVVLLLLTAPGVAASAEVPAFRSDGNDTNGPLDVRRVYKDDASPPGWTVTTWSRWTNARIWDAGYVLIFFDTFGTKRFDYYALLRSTGSRMQGLLWHDRVKQRDRQIAYLRTWRPDRLRVRTKIPLRKMILGARRLNYRWYVSTLYTGKRCPNVCFDRVPDDGAVVQPRVRPSPSPSPPLS